MPKEIIFNKLEQIRELLGMLNGYLRLELSTFRRDATEVFAAERVFQLIINLAIDINIQLLTDKNQMTPDTYQQSFDQLPNIGVLPENLAKELVRGAHLRNVLVHEYDIKEDVGKFYQTAKVLLGPLQQYCEFITEYMKQTK